MCVCVYTHVEIPLHKSKETREHWHIFTGAGVAQHPTHKCIFTLTKLQKSVYNPFMHVRREICCSLKIYEVKKDKK